MQAITATDQEINRDAARPMDAPRVARDLLHTSRSAALATLDPGGFPYVTTTNLIPAPDGAPIIFAARMALHARNMAADPRVSLALVAAGADSLVVPRLTLSGIIEPLPPEQSQDSRERYLRHFPKSKLYLGLPDAQLYRLRIDAVKLNGGPAQNASDVTPQGILTDLADAEDLLDNEAGLVASLNARPEVAARIAVAAGAGDGRWKITAIDPEGINLTTGDRGARWWFPARATSAAQAQAFTAALA